MCVQGPVNDLTCVAMTPAFLIFGSKRGTITYFFLEGRATVNEYRHQDGEIKKLFPNTIGTRCLFVDAQSQVGC
jgi:WD repeat-containing protein 19